jgi:aspartate 1-decarboxylase
MLRQLLKAKIHRATVTNADLNYTGSITIDADLMEQADIVEHEKVVVVDINNGQRFETYAIQGERSSGTICVNGAAARLVQVNDVIIIMSFASYQEDEIRGHCPKLVQVNSRNEVVATEHVI